MYATEDPPQAVEKTPLDARGLLPRLYQEIHVARSLEHGNILRICGCRRRRGARESGRKRRLQASTTSLP